jgi:hypothetical protein
VDGVRPVRQRPSVSVSAIGPTRRPAG